MRLRIYVVLIIEKGSTDVRGCVAYDTYARAKAVADRAKRLGFGDWEVTPTQLRSTPVKEEFQVFTKPVRTVHKSLEDKLNGEHKLVLMMADGLEGAGKPEEANNLRRRGLPSWVLNAL